MQDVSPAWQSSWGAVSVGAGASQDENGRTIPQRTRQIINLAAGTEDTDAVNVAQLKEAMSDARISIHAGEGIIVEKLGTEYTIKANLNGLSNEHGTVHILSDPGELPGTQDGPELRPARAILRAVAEPQTENGGPLHVAYVSNEVDFALTMGIRPSSTTEGSSKYWAETISIRLPALLQMTMAKPWTISTSI
ncbi:hypothetical protein [Acidaminococcus fermentans]